MEAELSDGGAWLVGNSLSLADINLAPYLARLEYLTLLDVWIAGRPRVRDWWERMKSRDAFRAAIAEPLTQEEREAMAIFGGKIRSRVQALHAGLPAFTAQ